MQAIIGVHYGEAHVDLSVRTEPAMLGIFFLFKLWNAKSIVTGTCIL